MVSGIEYCHANLVVHRDLKPENTLLDVHGNIKISDFGLSTMMEPFKLMESFCGSLCYAAPEILRGVRYSGPPVDVWRLGVILYVLLTGCLPWNGSDLEGVRSNCIQSNYSIPSTASKAVQHLLHEMLNPEPKDRIAIGDIRIHPWVNEGYDQLPSSILHTRDSVCDINYEILEQVLSLGFGNKTEVEAKILENENCEVVALYHLFLDRAVEAEMSNLKQQWRSNSRKSESPLRKSTLTIIREDEIQHNHSGAQSATNPPAGRRRQSVMDCYGTPPKNASSELVDTTPQPRSSRRHSVDAQGDSVDGSARSTNGRGNSSAPRNSGSKNGSNGDNFKPRVIKGIFSALTTTTKRPQEVAKVIKKVLQASPYFVKILNPLLFQCFEDSHNLKFEVEICKIAGLDILGIHFQRIAGDIWRYKEICFELVKAFGL